jgi:hypothetical protein
MIALVAILIMGASAVLVHSLSAAGARAERERLTTHALAQAKAALVARAVTDMNRPGSLPCPDTNDDGSAELLAGTACPSYIGRLPWRTLDLPDLRDASGERLWYLLSPSHRDHTSAQPINSDTIASISVAGTQPATGVIALVIAPGATLQRSDGAAQTRSCPGVDCTNPVNYFEIDAGIDNATAGTTFTVSTAEETLSFNDRYLPVLRDDIMPLVEKRAGREIASGMVARYRAWQSVTGRGFFPWAAPLLDPADPGLGVADTHYGMLPTTANPVVWSSASPPLLCTGVGTEELVCTAAAAGPIAITATVGSIATRFLEAPSAPEVSDILQVTFPSVTWTLNPTTQALEFSYSATLLDVVTIRVRVPALSSWASAAWLSANEWGRVIHYAVAPGHAITGDASCPSCLTFGASADIPASVIMTGRALAHQPGRPLASLPAQPQDYLEGGNMDASDHALDRSLRTAQFNDQPIEVRP